MLSIFCGERRKLKIEENSDVVVEETEGEKESKTGREKERRV